MFVHPRRYQLGWFWPTYCHMCRLVRNFLMRIQGVRVFCVGGLEDQCSLASAVDHPEDHSIRRTSFNAIENNVQTPLSKNNTLKIPWIKKDYGQKTSSAKRTQKQTAESDLTERLHEALCADFLTSSFQESWDELFQAADKAWLLSLQNRWQGWQVACVFLVWFFLLLFIKHRVSLGLANFFVWMLI